MKRSRAMQAIGILGALSTIATFSAAFSACGSDEVAAEGTPPPVVGGATDAATEPDNFIPPGCPVNATPADDPCVNIEALGVFVSKTLGSAAPNGGNGTLAAPFGSLQKGIAEAKLLKKRVYACAETYDEAITFENGVSVFGYFDCSKPTSWTVIAPPASTGAGAPPPGLRARIASPTSPAARANGVATDTVIESVDVVAPDAKAPSGSSVGLIAQNSPKLALSHVYVHAGVATKGDDGGAGVQNPDSPATRDGAAGFSPYRCHLTAPGSCPLSDPDCIDQKCVDEHRTRPGGTNSCGGVAGQAAGSGGIGGNGGHWYKTVASPCAFGYVDPLFDHASNGDVQPANAATNLGGQVGEPSVFTPPPPATGSICRNAASAGTPGANGAPGVNGSSAPAGTITINGFDPGQGAAGTSGAPGQGGGGGGGTVPTNDADPYYVNSKDYWGASGSGGGAGGCAGLAGTSGKGGGASIAIVLFDSPIALRNCTIEATNGGSGGRGSLGSDPTPPGEAGLVVGTGTVPHAGARGGNGGQSGWSGNGAGGHSIGIAAHGAAASLVDTPPPAIGTAGAGAPAIAGTGKAVPASGAGVAAAVHTF
jgi:hypothetical protein